jgi:hypothetical protein
MILHQATYKEFGYWPKSLLAKSRKHVLRKCDSCGRVDSIRYGAIGRGLMCRPCACSDRNRKAKPRIQLDKKNLTMPSLERIVDLYYCASLKNTLKRSAKKNGREARYQIFGQENGKSYAVPMAESLSLMYVLGLQEHSKNIKQEFKDALRQHLLTPSVPNRSRILTYIFEKHKTVSIARRGNYARYTVSDKHGLIRQIFDSLDFKYGNTGAYCINIESASLFIDGSWLHIGS